MSHIELTPQELPNFIHLAHNNGQQGNYHYTIVCGIIFLSAATTFLIEMGYL